MRVSDLDYELPVELIAQAPLSQREASRMMIVDRRTQRWHDSRFVEFPAQLREDDVVVLNNTRVFPARLAGERIPSGGRVELLLLKELEPNIWEALARPARVNKIVDIPNPRHPGAQFEPEFARRRYEILASLSESAPAGN